jgi:hypothetical protein
MLINIEEIGDKEVLLKTEDFEKRGGQLLFRLFRILENYEGSKPANRYDCHLVVARQTIERPNIPPKAQPARLNPECSGAQAEM